MEKQNAAAIAVAEEEQKSYTENEVLDLFRSADDATKQAALLVLKCEKPQLGDIMSMLSGVMENEGSKIKKAVDALTALSVMIKSKGGDVTQLQDFLSSAAAMINSACCGKKESDPANTTAGSKAETLPED